MNHSRTIGLVAALLTAGVAAPASATIDVRDHWHNEWTESFSDCGLATIDASFDYSGDFTTRELKSSDGTAWLGHQRSQFVEVYTNPANGRSFSVTGNSNWREIKGTRLHDNVWAFSWKNSGATFVLHDASGKVLERDRGTIVGLDVLDTLGDHEIGGHYISSDIVALHGQFTDLDWCTDIVGPLLG
jgi:hypothetical protein